MQEVNYILHLNAVFDQFSKDSRLNPTHISLYVALFQLWNANHFPKEFFVNRDEVMQLAKVGSKSTIKTTGWNPKGFLDMSRR